MASADIKSIGLFIDGNYFRLIDEGLKAEGADYDELVNELYLHIMANDARRLRMFEGRSSIYLWLKSVAHNFFLTRVKYEHAL